MLAICLHRDVLRRASLYVGSLLPACIAGAGSIFEALRARKPLLVVVNAGLMDNHQQELAEALAARGHLAHCAPAGLQARARQQLCCAGSQPA